MSKITHLDALEILESRGNPTIEVMATLDMVNIVDAGDKIRKLILVLDGMVDEGLITVSDVEVIKYVHQEAARS
jgi:hypothetical protein